VIIRYIVKSGLVRTYVTNIALNYTYIPRIEVAYTNCLASSLNIYADKTPVPSFDILSTYLSTSKKLYYNSSLSLNESIDLTSINL